MGVRQSSSFVGRKSESLNPGRRSTVWRRRRDSGGRHGAANCGMSSPGDWSKNWPVDSLDSPPYICVFVIVIL